MSTTTTKQPTSHQRPWWSSLKETDPITLQPLSKLKEPPFELISGDSQVVHRFDGMALAQYLVHTGNLINPKTREELDRNELKRLDEHVTTFKHAELAKCVQTFDAQRLLQLQQRGGRDMNAAQRREASTILLNLLNYPSQRDVQRTRATGGPQTSRPPLPAVTAAAAASAASRRASGRGGGLVVHDYDDSLFANDGVEVARPTPSHTNRPTTSLPPQPSQTRLPTVNRIFTISSIDADTLLTSSAGGEFRKLLREAGLVLSPIERNQSRTRVLLHGQPTSETASQLIQEQLTTAQGKLPPSHMKKKDDAPPPSSQQQQQTWECDSCTFVNKPGSVKCAMCGHSAPSRFSHLVSNETRPHLKLAPPTKNSSTLTATTTTTERPSSIFGAARPREEILNERGIDYRQQEKDLELAHRAVTLLSHEHDDTMLCPYVPQMLREAKAIGATFVTEIETRLVLFLQSGERVLDLKPMKKSRRAFVMQVAARYWSISGVELDPEPNTFVRLSVSHVASPPRITISQALVRFPDLVNDDAFIPSTAGAGILFMDVTGPRGELPTTAHFHDFLSAFSGVRPSEYTVKFASTVGAGFANKTVFVEFASSERARNLYCKIRDTVGSNRTVRAISFESMQHFPVGGMPWIEAQLQRKVAERNELVAIAKSHKAERILENKSRERKVMHQKLKDAWGDDDDDHVQPPPQPQEVVPADDDDWETAPMPTLSGIAALPVITPNPTTKNVFGTIDSTDDDDDE